MLGPIAAFLSSVTWAIGTAGYSKLSRTNSAFAVNFTRGLFAFPVFLIATFIVAGSFNAGLQDFGMFTRTNLIWAMVSMIASYGLGDTLFYWSTRSLGVPGALAIASCSPALATAGGVIFQGEPLLAQQALGLLVTIVGVVIVILNGPKDTHLLKDAPGTHERFSKRSSGVMLAFMTCFLWGLNAFAVSRVGVGVSPLVGNTVRMALAMFATSFLGLLIAGRKSPVVLSYASVRPVWWIFAVESIGGSFFFMYGLSHSPLVIGATLTSLAPVLAVPAAWAFGSEKLSLRRTLGVVLSVVGVWLLVSAH